MREDGGGEEVDEVLDWDRHKVYRAVAARANYLALDRPDIQYAVKEACRAMSKPMEKDWLKLKRLARYLKGKPRLVQRFAWQAKDQILNGYSDANWAGCKKTRKSTSGGSLMLGAHCIRTWGENTKHDCFEQRRERVVCCGEDNVGSTGFDLHGKRRRTGT